MRQISGKRKTHHIRYLVSKNGTRIDDARKMVDELATQFTKTIVTKHAVHTTVQKEKGPRGVGTTGRLQKRRTIQ
jgi:hypothetical protein